MQPESTPRRRGLLLLIIALLIATLVVLATRADAAPAGDPSTEVYVARLGAKLERQERLVALLRRDVRDLQDEVARLDRITHLWACTVKVYEDGSARFRDAERVSRSCRDYIAEYVGGPHDTEDLE